MEIKKRNMVELVLNRNIEKLDEKDVKEKYCVSYVFMSGKFTEWLEKR